MKTLLLMNVLALSAFAATAQTSSYTFIREGGSLSYLDTANHEVIDHLIANDMVLPAKVKIGFPFKFNGVTYDSLGISENGFIWFGPAQADAVASIINPITEVLPAGVTGIVCAFGIDLHPHTNTSQTTTIRSLREDFAGHPDNFIIEWRNTGRIDALNDPAGEDTLNFQIQLFALEEDRVQITYGVTNLNPNIVSHLSVGMIGADNTDFAIRMTDATHPWDNTLAGTDITGTCELSTTSNPSLAPHNYMSWVNRSRTGLADQLDPASFTVYPVPVNDLLFVDHPDNKTINTCRIYNSEGKLVLEEAHLSPGIQTGQLSKGIYTLQLLTDNGIATKRFVKN